MKKVIPPTWGRGELEKLSKIISQTFADFDIPVKIVDAIEGLRNYHFHVQPEKPSRMKAMSGFKDDLRYALSSNLVEIEAPMPDKKLVGITIPKKDTFPIIPWSEAVKKKEFIDSGSLTVPLGIDEFGEEKYLDIARTPHMLMGGCTGSGKSNLLHSLISSLIKKNSPDEILLILCDPKRVELTLYAGIPHLLTPVIVDAKKACRAFFWAVKEMERRYDILEAEKTQNITAYHKLVHQPAKKKWEARGSKSEEVKFLPEAMPFIVIVVDELSDLMYSYPKEFEANIVQLAQMARAVGIHLIISTSRPSVSVVTGTIKANLPTRIALMTASQIDSRTILDVAGAEKLQGQGDMLYQSADAIRPCRIQGYYISEVEIRDQVKKLHLSEEKTAALISIDAILNSDEERFFTTSEEKDDDLYEEARKAVIEAGKASTSYLQRKLRIGYSRAARLLDLLEEAGVIGPQNGATPREVLIDK